jgi:multiple sugar transport system permease protein
MSAIKPTTRSGRQLPPVEPPVDAPDEAGRRRTHETGFGEARAHWLAYLVLGVGLVVVTSPFLWMALSSFKSEGEIRQVPPTWIPEAPTLDNFRELFQRLDFPQFFTNSTIVAIAVTLGNVIFCSMLGYVLAKSDFAGKKLLFRLVLGTLMVPGMVTLVPLFVLVANMGLVNTYFGLILPFLAAPFGVFLMRQFFLGIPDELIDAARVDGASEARIFVQVVMPLAKPALATLGIITFLGSWNNFLWPLVVATTEDKYTLPVALALYSTGQNRTDFGLLLAGAVVVVVPVLIVFLLLQRYFVQGVAMTGIK